MASSLELLALAKLSFWDSKPTATLYQTSVWASPNNVNPYNTVPFQASSEDNWGGHNNVTNNTRYTIQVAGTYRVSGSIMFATNSTGIRAINVQKNGTALTGIDAFVNAGASSSTSVMLPAANVVCAAGDYLELGGYQNSGGSLNTATLGTYMSVEFLHF